MISPSSSSDDRSCSDFPAINLKCKVSRNLDNCMSNQLKDLVKLSSSSDKSDKEISDRESGRKKSNRGVRKDAKKQKFVQKKLSGATGGDNKIYKPEECMKDMNLEMHERLLENLCMPELVGELKEAKASIITTTGVRDPALVTWSRTLHTYVTVGDQIKSSHQFDTALYVLPAEEVDDLVNGDSLSKFITEKKEQVGKSLSLVIYGLDNYFKSGRKSHHKGNKKKFMTQTDLEMAIAEVIISTDCDVIKINSPTELTKLLLRFSKAIAEKPYKIAKRAIDDKAAFYMRGDNRNCVAVDKDGTGLIRLWQQMVAILPSSSLEIARALTDKYKSPLSFFEAINESDGVKQLSDVGVARTGVPGAKQRRIGPEFARKLYTLFTARDGNILID